MNKHIKNLLLMFLIYFLAHYFLLIATGNWWDDWCYVDHDVNYTLKVFRMSGIPLHAYINIFAWHVPFRILVFFIHYFIGVIVYYIFNKIHFLKSTDAFFISVLFLVAPCNDARITFICFGYTIGFFFFWISFFFSTIWVGFNEKNKRVLLHFISLLFLFLSFDTESIMLMTLLIIFYFYYYDLRDNWNKYSLKEKFYSMIKSNLKHFDYFLLPILWYSLNKIFFPTSGIFKNHSVIPWERLMDLLIKSPFYFIQQVLFLGYNYIRFIWKSEFFFALVIIIFFVFVLIVFIEKDKCISFNKENVFFSLIMVLFGFICMYIGFFPYYIKFSSACKSYLVGSRNTLLLGFGFAMFIYYFFRIFFKSKLLYYINILVILFGVLYFNFVYLRYQESYYHHLSFQNYFTEVDTNDNDTIILSIKNYIVSRAYYTFCGSYFEKTHKQDHFFISDQDGINKFINYGKTDDDLKSAGYREYSFDNKTPKMYIKINFNKENFSTIIKQKINELFNKKEFIYWINNEHEMQTYVLNDSVSDRSMEIMNKDKDYLKLISYLDELYDKKSN